MPDLESQEKFRQGSILALGNSVNNLSTKLVLFKLTSEFHH